MLSKTLSSDVVCAWRAPSGKRRRLDGLTPAGLFRKWKPAANVAQRNVYNAQRAGMELCISMAYASASEGLLCGEHMKE